MGTGLYPAPTGIHHKWERDCQNNPPHSSQEGRTHHKRCMAKNQTSGYGHGRIGILASSTNHTNSALSRCQPHNAAKIVRIGTERSYGHVKEGDTDLRLHPNEWPLLLFR
jgi:hypothetical protein